MHGGIREKTGIKMVEYKKQAISVYIILEEREIIETLSLSICNRFSDRLKELIKLGIDSIKLEIEESKNQISYMDLFSGLGGIRISFKEALSDHRLSGQ